MMTSITDIQTYKRCRRKWNYSSSNRGNLTKVGHSAPALELGSLVHLALADWTVAPENKLDEIFAHHSIDRIKKIKKEYKERIGAKISEEEIAPMYELSELGLHMMINYQTHWKTPLPDNFKFALPEQEFVVNIPGTEHACPECLNYNYENRIVSNIRIDKIVVPVKLECTECNGTGIAYHKLRGILDGLIQRYDDVYFSLERKTFSPRYRPQKTSLRRTDQFVGYTWVMRQLGVPNVGGLAYDGMSKQKAPSKTGQYTKLSDLFIRTVIQYTADELDQWGENLARTVNEMASITPDMIYPNIPWNGCDDCSFINLCDAENRAEDVEHLIQLTYVQRPNTKPVLRANEEYVA